MSNPLNLVTDPEIKQMRIESLTVFPRTINDNETGGQVHFVLPNKGYLSSDSRIVLPSKCADPAYQYPPNVGVFSLIGTATLSTESSGVIAQIDNAGELYANMNLLTPPEKKRNIDSVLHGINYVFETASSSKCDGVPANVECMPGMFRLQCDEYKQEAGGKSKGRKNARPNRLDGRNTLKLTTESGTTAQYSISLSDLFPGLFGDAWSLPLQLIDEEILLDITFSNNSDFGNNERAIFCPSLATVDPTAITSVGVYSAGEGLANTTQKDVILSNPTGGSGSGLRLLCDLTNAVVSNIRVLDTGSGYAKGDTLTFSPDNWQSDMVVHPAHKFASVSSDVNFWPTAGGADFTQDDEYVVENPYGENFKIKATNVDAGALAECTIDAATNNQLSLPRGVANEYLVYKADGTTDSGARLAIGWQEVVLTSTKNGDIADNTILVLVLEGGEVTEVMMLKGTPAATDVFQKDAGNSITVNAITSTSDNLIAQFGYDPVFSYDSVSSGKINIDTNNVMITTDIIYYMDGKPEADWKAMNSKTGIQKLYTQYRNIKTSLTDKDSVSTYADKEVISYNRLIGFSNSVLRSLMWNVYPSGAQDKVALPYHGKSKMNPLLLKYCSRASAVQGGETFNVNINSVPYYSSELQTDMRFFRELNKCEGNMFLNKGTYQLWNQCRQLDAGNVTMTDALPSAQPGFSDIDNNTEPTQQYQLSDVKSAIVMDSWNGISQHHLRGMNKINGCSFELIEGANVPGNGAQIGSQNVDVNYSYTHTLDVGGTGTLNLYGKVQRLLILKNGKFQVTSASF